MYGGNNVPVRHLAMGYCTVSDVTIALIWTRLVQQRLRAIKALVSRRQPTQIMLSGSTLPLKKSFSPVILLWCYCGTGSVLPCALFLFFTPAALTAPVALTTPTCPCQTGSLTPVCHQYLWWSCRHKFTACQQQHSQANAKLSSDNLILSLEQGF